MEHIELTELLAYINPSTLSYQEWVNIGMALKHEGYDVSDFDSWSLGDPARYHQGECAKKWESFNGSESPVTGATIVKMAKNNGWHAYQSIHREGDALDWDAEIGSKDELRIVNTHWVEERELAAPSAWEPEKQLIKYLEILFEQAENVGYVVKSYKNDKGKYVPSDSGSYSRTAGQLVEELQQCGGDIGSVLGDYNPEAGAWIRFNPLDGKGVKNDNVTEYRYALVESDNEDIEKQNAIFRELELPIACLVFSGKKSLHAIVRIDAADYTEYRKRVDYLYGICEKNGLIIDKNNRNPSRLSRMPGVIRGDQKQYIVDTNIGKSGWNEWKEWIESVNDSLPDLETLADVWDNMPELSPPLIHGVLRQGHKMLLAGPSKAGKSYALIELCIAIAEGKEWLGFSCAQGKVIYVNLELDEASCKHRFKDVYNTLGLQPDNIRNIDMWHLRGKSVPMDKLAPMMIRRAAKKKCIAIIIDPIYKVITGDENSADQMAHFCNQFDKVCTELGCAVIYCHHHSKGSQGSKRSMDRASGSGVFARDPDALLDLIELEPTEALIKQQQDKQACEICTKHLKDNFFKLEDYVSQDDACSRSKMIEICRKLLNPGQQSQMFTEINVAEKEVDTRSAWRIEGTLREFPKFQPVNVWFDYPIHRVDSEGFLADICPEGEMPPWQKNFGKKKSPEDIKKEKKESLETAFSGLEENGKSTLKDLAEYMGVTEKTVRNRIKEHGGFWIDKGYVGKK